ncbi:MAG TPA: outer membrane beta-barrel protein, partial [Holophagaceae bacterium]
MRPRLMTLLLAGAAGGLSAQATGPALTWHGSVWASAVSQDRETADGSLVFRPIDAGQSQFSLDGLMLGVDAAFPQGWSARATLLAGNAGKVVQASTGDTGSIAVVEAMLVWTGRRDTLRLGRMITFIGMEFLDGSADMTASRGLLFSFVDPFGQVGVNWHHTFSPSWSSDAWVFNGEDRLKDNNHGKTVGFGLTWNAGGSADRYLSLHAYRGPEQDGLGAAANTGAEGRLRERLCLMGQSVWGKATLLGEATLGREAFPAEAIRGAAGTQRAIWRGFGLIL